MICKIEYVGIHLLQIPLDWNVIPGLGIQFRTGDTTFGKTVKETVKILCEELHPLHMPLPTTESLKNNANEYENIWNFPHILGCLDGKHIRIVCPTDSGAMFFNYNKYFSIVLQGLVDANCKFITVDMGGFGKQSDGGTFLASDLFRFIDGKMNELSRTGLSPSQLSDSSVRNVRR